MTGRPNDAGDFLVRWFSRIWGATVLIGAVLWLWRSFPLGLALIGLAGLLVLRLIVSERRRHARQGYWVEFLGPGVLRGGDDEFAVVYHEGEHQVFFHGKKGHGSELDVLVAPSQSIWTLQAPGPMRDHQALILERVTHEFNRHSTKSYFRIRYGGMHSTRRTEDSDE